MFRWPVTQTAVYTATLYNNIIVGNPGCGITAWHDFNLVSDFSDVWNNGANYCDQAGSGPNDISANPLFVDAATGDYRIRFGSPAMNAGANAYAPPYDKGGTARPQGGRVDMGAYEVVIYELYLHVTVR